MTTFNKDTYKPSRIIGSSLRGGNNEIDVSEDVLYLPSGSILNILLMDRTTGENIIWATDNYEDLGEGYTFSDEILPERITGDKNLLIQPRIAKDKSQKSSRTKEKAEVFTPSWLCKMMNDVVDDAWFASEMERASGGSRNNAGDAGNETGGEGSPSSSGCETEHMFDTALGEKVDFAAIDAARDKGKKKRSKKAKVGSTDGDRFPKPALSKKEKEALPAWQRYVLSDRLEITCGEAPYLVSRYDATTGAPIAIMDRYGILDRKLRAVSENTEEMDEWLFWAKRAYQHTYGYEWQGDSILLARENMFAGALDHFCAKFGDDAEFPEDDLREIANIISWNIWQMDGLKFVVPGSCGRRVVERESLFGLNDGDVIEECKGCAKGKRDEHNGTYALVMDWEREKPVRFVDLLDK